MGQQLPDVNCEYGAPMGRMNHPVSELTRTVRLFRVNLDVGGYDDGGAYWGHGQTLYCATEVRTDGYRAFFRANSRDEAKTEVRELHPEAKFYR